MSGHVWYAQYSQFNVLKVHGIRQKFGISISTIQPNASEPYRVLYSVLVRRTFIELFIML